MAKQNTIIKINTHQAEIIPIHAKSDAGSRLNAITLKDQSGFDIIPYDEIIRCEADGNYTHVHTIHGRQITTSKALKHIENQLPSKLFIRIHQSHLVSRSAVRRIDGAKFVLLADGTQLPFSRRLKAKLLAAFNL